MNSLNIEPVDGRNLPIETNRQKLVSKPMIVPSTSYYRRAIRRGDIAESKPQTKPQTKKAVKAAKESS